MKLAEINGSNIFLVDGWWMADGKWQVAQFGILASDLKIYGARGQATSLAQFYMMVIPGLVMTRHIFQGLNRPLYCDECSDGDKDKLIHTWKPSIDWYWQGDGINGKPIRSKSPSNSVFSVIISTNNNHKESYPMVKGWIEHWNWVAEDDALREAPNDWVDRYDQKIFTRVG